MASTPAVVELDGGAAPRSDVATDTQPSLQDRVDAVLLVRNDDTIIGEADPALLCVLMCDLLDASELEAFVRVYDAAKSRRVDPDPAVRRAMERRHNRRSKGKNSLRVPMLPAGTRALAPSRRLHKIVVGPIRGQTLARRNAAATPDKVDRVAEWAGDPTRQSDRARELLTRKAWETKSGRRKLAAEMGKAKLGLSKEAALGVITSLKRKKIFK